MERVVRSSVHSTLCSACVVYLTRIHRITGDFKCYEKGNSARIAPRLVHAIGRENGTLLRSVGSHAVRSMTSPKMVIRIIYPFTDPPVLPISLQYLQRADMEPPVPIEGAGMPAKPLLGLRTDIKKARGPSS
jgi:hypothetical protein